MFELTQQNVLISLSVFSSAVASIVYMASIFKGNTRPHRTTRFVVAFATTVAFTSLIADDSKITVWFLGVSTIFGVVIFLLSIKYGLGGASRIDIASLFIAIAGIILWILTNEPILALLLSIGADFVGYVPAFIKTWHLPKSEGPFFYILSLVTVTLTMIANGKIDREIIYPAYIFLATLFMLALIYRNELKSRIINSTT